MDNNMRRCRRYNPCVAPSLCDPVEQCLVIKRLLLLENGVCESAINNCTSLCFYLENQRPLDLLMEDKEVLYVQREVSNL